MNRIKLFCAVTAVMLLMCSCTRPSVQDPDNTSLTDSSFSSPPGVSEQTAPEETTVVPWEDGIPNICSSRYGYYSLDASEKAVYDEIYEAARRFDGTVEIKRSITKSRLEEICRILYLEETSLYYLSKEYSILFNADTGMATSVELTYNYDFETVRYMNTMTEEAVAEILGRITSDMSDVDKIKLFHDEIVLNCKYSDSAEYGATPYGVFVDGNALCEGYARAFAILCNKSGIENLFATGTQYITNENGENSSEEHIWNMVKVDGLWYNIDTTWDDPTSSKLNQPLSDDYISYSYFLIPSNELRISMIVDQSLFTLPEANSLESNYFVYYGYYATTYEEAEEILTRSINEAVANGEHYVRIKFSDSDLYMSATNKLFRDRAVFDLCPGVLPPKLDFYWNETTRSIQLGI